MSDIPAFSSLAEAGGAPIPSACDAVRLIKNGGAVCDTLYGRTAIEPPAPLKFQNPTGSWWRPIEDSVTVEDFGWNYGGDVGPALRAAFDYCKNSSIKTIRLSYDPTTDGGHYRIWSPSASNERCVLVDGPGYNGIKLIGLGRDISKLRYDHDQGLVSRSILSAQGADIEIHGVDFDGREQDRKPVPGLSLAVAATSASTSLTISGIGALPNSGMIRIDDEWIFYNAKTGSDLTGCVRGCRGTSAAAHANNAVVVHLIRTGHHPVALENFRRCKLIDVGVRNSPGYGLGIENTLATEYIENLDIFDLRIVNTAADGVDVKCPKVNGNTKVRIDKLTIEGWSRENGYPNPDVPSNPPEVLGTLPDVGFDCRIQGAQLSNVILICTPYMGSSIGLGVRDSLIGDFSGGEFTAVSNIQFLGCDLPGTYKPTHTGLADGGMAVITGFAARGLSGFAATMRGSSLVNFVIDRCDSGVGLSAPGSYVAAGAITRCALSGVRANVGTTANDSVVENVSVANCGFGFAAAAGVGMTVRNCRAVDNSPNGGATNRNYFLNAGCRVQKTPGTTKTVASASYTMTNDDDVLLLDTSAGPITLIPPHATEVSPGRTFTVLKISNDSNGYTIDPVGAGQINGGSTFSSASKVERRIHSDGVAYWTAP